MPSIIVGVVWEDSGAALMARIEGNDAINITQATIDSINWKLFDNQAADPKAVVDSGTFDKTVDIFDALQTDARWSFDSVGYNFRHDSPAAWYAEAAHRYEVEVKFSPVSGAQFWAIFKVLAKPVKSS